MQIFMLDENPRIAARAHCDKHVVKMIIETAQILCCCHERIVVPFSRTKAQYNHTMCRWVRESVENYLWLVELGIYLCKEYTHRYGKRHKTQDLMEWLEESIPDLPVRKQTPIKLPPSVKSVLLPSEQNRKDFDPVTAYRLYYQSKFKSMKMTWKNREIPEWI